MDSPPSRSARLKMKAGAGRTNGCRMASEPELEALRDSGEVVWENRRYNAVYIIGRPYLLLALALHHPVLHIGQTEAVAALKSSFPAAR
jgi:guanylate kinase